MTKTTLSLVIFLMILLAFVATFFFSFVMETRPGLFGLMNRSEAGGTELSDLTDGESLLLSDQLRQVRREIEDRRAELERVKADLETVRSELPPTSANIDELKWKIADLTAERDRLRPLEAAVRRLRIENEELRRQIEELTKTDPLEAYMTKVQATRRMALETLRKAIVEEFPDLDVVINADADALRFQGEGLFASGARGLTAPKRQIVERIATLLDEMLACYTLGPRADHSRDCNPGFAVLDVLQIEGHTDDVGSNVFNAALASDRAVSTYAAMIAHVPGLSNFRNLRDEPVLSVASFGESRPIATNDTTEGRAVNRRIELRFIMYTPSQIREIASLRAALTQARPDVADATR